MSGMINPVKGNEPEPNPWDEALMLAETVEEIEALPISKALSSKFGKPDKRRAQLVARLKRRRKYGDPVKGGTGRHKKKGGRGHFK